MKNFTVTSPSGATQQFPADQLERVILKINGGGMFEHQVVNAMTDALEVSEGRTVERNGWKVSP